MTEPMTAMRRKRSLFSIGVPRLSWCGTIPAPRGDQDKLSLNGHRRIGGISEQGRAPRSPHHDGACDLVVPGLALRVEYHPDEPQARYGRGQEAAQCTHDGRRPVDLPPIQPHDTQIADDPTHRRSPELPHDGA